MWYKKLWSTILVIVAWFRSVVEAPTGGISSKRVFGLACLVIASILAFQFADKAAITSGAFLGAAVAVFITQAASGT